MKRQEPLAKERDESSSTPQRGRGAPKRREEGAIIFHDGANSGKSDDVIKNKSVLLLESRPHDFIHSGPFLPRGESLAGGAAAKKNPGREAFGLHLTQEKK
jgi:hypothetical protein